MLRKERTRVICDELKKLSKVKSFQITQWKKKDGFFIRPEDAENSKEPWQEFDSRTMMWSGKDRHFWFAAEFTVPDDYAGKPVFFVIQTQIEEQNDMNNPQFLVFVNGNPVQGADMNHREILLAESAEVGRRYRIDLQAYTGTLHARLFLIGNAVQVSPEIQKLYYDLDVPLCVAEKMEDGQSEELPLEIALEKTIDLLDLRIPYSKEFYSSVQAAEDYLQQAVYKDLAGSDEVIASCIGHTHIDVAWLWTVSQTREKVARSFSTVLKLMDEYPEYKFMSSQPQNYAFLKERYPEIYAKIKQRVKEGRWEPEGGMWVEADCNLTSGESLVRQFLYGKRFFKEEFNVDSKVLWLPDAFGYSAALPQIMKKCGIKYFMTTKIAWNEFDKFPYDTFWWVGIDGTPIFSYLITTKGIDQPKDSFFTTYNGMLHPAALMGGWERYQQKDLNNHILVCYGYGDGGGGPTREMLETGRRMESGIKGAPKVKQEFSGDFFDGLSQKLGGNPNVPKWFGELYLEYHRGTYTSMGRNKRANRKSEFALMNLEFLSAWAERLGLPYPKEEIESMWKTVLLNQFHDILPGSAIKEVYDVTEAEYKTILKNTQELMGKRLEAIASASGAGGNKIAVFNTLSFRRSDQLTLETSACSLKEPALFDEDGNSFPLQKTSSGKLTAWVCDLPPKGLKVFRLAEGTNAETPFQLGDGFIETPYYKIKLDSSGFFASIYDKRCEREVLAPNQKGNVLRAYEDKPAQFDNWNIDLYYSRKSWAVDAITKMEWVENGPVQAVLYTERHYCNSTIQQKIHFYAHSPRIDFETCVDWKEHQQLLKVEFPVDGNAGEATYEIQFGNIKRPTHSNTSWEMAKFEVCGHKWADLSDGGYGVSLLNDCKYGYSIKDQVMALTLIKSGIYPNAQADKEKHRFTYAILPHSGSWQEARTVQEAYMLNVPLLSSQPAESKASEKVTEKELFRLSAENVILETAKEAEDGNGLILRAYEYENKRTKVKISLDRRYGEISECDMLENKDRLIAENASEFVCTMNPYEIKTFRLEPVSGLKQ